MAIYARCCGKDYKSSKKKCEKCNKKFTKFVVRVRDSLTKKWRTKTVPSLKMAREVEAKFKTELIEGQLFDRKQTGTIDFSKYLAYAKLHKKTWKMDESRWRIHVADHDYMTKRGILGIMATMKENDYSPCTVHHVLKLIKRVFNWHIENEYYFDKNPCDSIKAPKYDNKVTDYFSKEEINNLLQELDNWDNKRASSIIEFALYTGRRKGEITNLEWGDIDFDNKTITCRNTKNGKNLSFPLNDKAYNVILYAHKNKISNYVFPSSSGKYYYNGFSLAWKRLKKRIGLNYRFHDLRHTFASHLASSGQVDIYTLKSLLGHQDIALTQRYAHLSNDAVRNANNVIDNLF